MLGKQQWLSDPPCLRHSESRRFFDQRQQGRSDPEERTTNCTSLGKDLPLLKTKVLCECHVDRIIAKRTALESTAALSNYNHHRERVLRQILPEIFAYDLDKEFRLNPFHLQMKQMWVWIGSRDHIQLRVQRDWIKE